MQSVKNQQVTFDLQQAMANNELVLHYQPQFNVINSTFDGVEALIRWQHPSRGLVMPADIFALADAQGLHLDIGSWVLRTACLQIKDWLSKGLPFMRIAVNVTGLQLQQPTFVREVRNLLEEIGLDASYLELEVAEDTVIHDDDHMTIAAIRKLSQLGVLIALDDFGTGYSGISHLRKIPVNRIKLDKTFIDNININHIDTMLVQSLITMAANMQMEIVAEGVETLIQLKTLLAQQCPIMQGYYFSKPLPATAMEKFLREYKQTELRELVNL